MVSEPISDPISALWPPKRSIPFEVPEANKIRCLLHTFVTDDIVHSKIEELDTKYGGDVVLKLAIEVAHAAILMPFGRWLEIFRTFCFPKNRKSWEFGLLHGVIPDRANASLLTRVDFMFLMFDEPDWKPWVRALGYSKMEDLVRVTLDSEPVFPSSVISVLAGYEVNPGDTIPDVVLVMMQDALTHHRFHVTNDLITYITMITTMCQSRYLDRFRKFVEHVLALPFNVFHVHLIRGDREAATAQIAALGTDDKNCDFLRVAFTRHDIPMIQLLLKNPRTNQIFADSGVPVLHDILNSLPTSFLESCVRACNWGPDQINTIRHPALPKWARIMACVVEWLPLDPKEPCYRCVCGHVLPQTSIPNDGPSRCTTCFYPVAPKLFTP